MASNRLTWDQVRAPDFEGVLDGFIASSNLIGNAMKTAQSGLDRIKGAQTDNADNQVMSKLLRYQGNPDALTADLGSGAFQSDVDMSKISAGMREHLSKAPTELLKFAADKSDYDQSQQRIGDMQKFRDNNALLVEWNRLTRSGKQAEADALYEANVDKFQELNFGIINGVDDGNAKAYSSNIRNWDDRFDYDDTVRTDRINQAFKKIDDAAFKAGVLPGDTEGAIRWMNLNRGTLEKEFNADEVSAALARYRGDYSNAGGAGGGSGGGASGSGGVNAGAIVGSTDDASAVREAASQLGINPEDLAAAMSYETGGKFDPGIVGGKNNAHMGLIQFGADEQRKYGIKPGMSIKEQMPAVVQYLKDRGLRPGDGLDRIYRTINGGNREANVKLSDGNGTIEQHIAKIDKEHRGNARAFLGLANPRDTQVLTQAGTAFNAAFDQETVQARDALAATQDPRSAIEIAQELTGEKGAFKGQDANSLAKKIYTHAQQAGVSPAAVVWAIKQHTTGTGGMDFDKIADSRGGALMQWLFTDSLTSQWNDEGFQKSLNFVKDRGALLGKIRAADEMQRNAAAVGAANNTVTSLQKTIDDRNAMARRLGMQAPDNRFYEEELGKARALQSLAGQAATQSTLAGDTSIKTNNSQDAPVDQAAAALEPIGVRKAKGVMRLTGQVGQRQRALFEKTYGVTPEAVIENPALLDTLGQGRATTTLAEATPLRDSLRADAMKAVAAGASAIAAFKQLHGTDPRIFLQN